MREALIERPHPAGMGGTQRVFRFANGFGASVVKYPYSYGGLEDLWELAVVRFTGESADSYELTYDTPITDSLEGYLSDDDVERLLAQIEGLPDSQNAANEPRSDSKYAQFVLFGFSAGRK